MTKSTFNILGYYTNVDLAQGLTTNLAEIELALHLNPNTFSQLILFDQANGKDYRSAAFPTGWNGTDDYDTNGFRQDVWSDTGLGLIGASNISTNDALLLLDYANQAKDDYADLIQYLLNRTGSSYRFEPNDWGEYQLKLLGIEGLNLGISTDFNVIREMQTGSPQSVDFILNESNGSEYFNQNPHAFFLANHGGSYLYGGNGDGPEYDLDEFKEYLHVTDFAASLQSAIQTYSPSNQRLGLVAYDECLMANIETLTELSSSTRYLLAAQEIIPGNGYDYFLTLSEFEVDNSLSSQYEIEEAAKSLGNAFVNTYSDRNGPYETLSLTDTNQVPILNQAIKSYVDAFINSSDSFIVSLLKSIRQKGTSYSFEFLQDLGNVALITKFMPGVSVELVAASDQILAALDSTVISNNQNYRPFEGFQSLGSSGLTITLPTTSFGPDHSVSGIQEEFASRAPAFEAATGWSRLISRIEPLLADVQTNSGGESSKAIFKTTNISPQVGDQAFIALQLEGYVSYTSSDRAINQNKVKIPDLANATVADLEFALNVLNLNSAGTIGVTIEDKNGNKKASWLQDVDKADLYLFDGASLSASLGSQIIEKGDSITLTPDENIAARYDLDLTADNQSLQAYDSYFPETDRFEVWRNPTLFSTKATDGLNNRFIYTTPTAPNGGSFTTDIVLLSSNEGEITFSIEDWDSGDAKTFTSDSYIDEYIELAGSTDYLVSFGYESASGSAPNFSSSDISLSIDHYASETFLLKDSVLTSSIELGTWGEYSINQMLNSDLLITEMKSDARIANLNDLQEGKPVDAQFNTSIIQSASNLENGKTGGTQTFTSGIWSSDFAYTFNTTVDGTSANTARLGFFVVDDLTGGIITDSGLIAASNSDAYRTAALDSLIAPLAILEGRDKSGTVEFDVEAGINYAAILLTTDQSGRESALFSIASANPTQNAQLLNFGSGYFGWEDMVKGLDRGYDGDFNDITFYTA